MLLQQEAKEIMGNIFLVHRNNHADVFKVSNMEKYIFKRYYSLDAFFWIDYLYECLISGTSSTRRMRKDATL